jgi:hypothetical protein
MAPFSLIEPVSSVLWSVLMASGISEGSIPRNDKSLASFPELRTV